MTTATERKIGSPARIGDGWGARVAGGRFAEIITVRTAAGKEWSAKLIQHMGGDVWATARIDAPPSTIGTVHRATPAQRGGRRTGCACGSREGVTRPTDCYSCRHDA